MPGQHPWLDQTQMMIASLDSVNDPCINFLVCTLSRPAHWMHYRDVREDALLKLAEIVEHVQIAFPTRALPVPERLSGDDATGGPTSAAVHGQP